MGKIQTLVTRSGKRYVEFYGRYEGDLYYEQVWGELDWNGLKICHLRKKMAYNTHYWVDEEPDGPHNEGEDPLDGWELDMIERLFDHLNQNADSTITDSSSGVYSSSR